ncbi:hypothetical protein DRH29_03970 [candidate division Kazan bacterium]|uniref:Ig-like domain-containing protein n=1 Tax=candidate division Kazan bacterium TaxID=2202143 RepID=A0A420ZBQ2_UNCK3|nr:MAG: hypothetical protein DRH29_03970 [candidate division Kazan bacterium]
MVLTIFSGLLNPASLSFAADKSVIVNDDLTRKKVNLEQPRFYNGEKTKEFSADESLKKSAEVKQPEKQNYVEGEVLVKFKEQKIDLEQSVGRTKARQFAVSKNLDKKEDVRKSNISVLKIKDSKTVEEKIAELKNDSRVEYVQPNFLYYPLAIDTNDTYGGLLWGLDNTGQNVNGVSGIDDADIDAPEAWEMLDGSEDDVIVAVIDDGVAYNHPDLIDNMWDGTNCSGSDKNGNPLSGNCLHGYDYEDNDLDPLPTSGSHGTHIAGTIGAVKNNGMGIIGVAPNVKIMALKVDYSTSQIVKSIDFAEQNGAKVINASWGCYGSGQGGTHAVCGGDHDYRDQAMINAIESFSGLFIVAAGNGDGDTDEDGDDHDNGQTLHFYPCDHTSDNIICVAATDSDDNLADFSDYGVNSVDVGAPGVNIYSTVADTTLFSEDFESYQEGSFGNFIPGGNTTNWWGVGHDGYSQVIYTDYLTYLTQISYEPNAFTYIEKPIDLSSPNIVNATLSFNIWCDTPSSATYDDYVYTDYFSNGDWHASKIYDEDRIIFDGGSEWVDHGFIGHYKKYTEDISNYLTSDFKFSFNWVTDSTWDNNFGCTIDDIKITKYTDGSDGNYNYASGTSMAVPHVAGLAALIWGYKPELSYSDVKNVILATGDSLDSLAGRTTTGKRINAHKALLSLTDTTPPIRDNGLPTGELSSGTTETVISLETDENAICRYSETADTAYSEMSNTFSTTGKMVHSTTVTGLSDGQSYTYYVRCEDETGNSNTDDFEISFSVAEAINTPPVMQSVILNPNPAYTNTNLTATAVASDSDGDTVTFSYQWKKSIAVDYEFEDIIGETDPTLSSDNFVKGNIIKVEVTPSDGTDDGDPMESDPITISNSIPTQPTVSIEPNPAYANNDLTCNAFGSSDDDGDSLSYLYKWYKDGVIQEDYTSTTIDSSLTATGEVWKCVVVANDGEAQGPAGEDSVTILETPDEVSPIITEVTPIPTPTNDNTPNYTFHSTKAGTITYDGGCVSDTVDAVEGDNTITFNKLDDGVYGGCEITVTDADNNTSVPLVITTFIVDTTPPVITLIGDDPVELFVGDDYTEYGATAEDIIDGDISEEIVIDDSDVDTSAAGIYEVTYNVSDAAGNQADEVIRIVNILEEPMPTYYATVIKLSDSKGNTELQSEYNNGNHTWPSPYPVLKVGETITIEVNVDNMVADPVLYEFVGTGFPNIWQADNNVTITIDEDIFNLETIHLRVFIKNSDNQYRAPNYDDMIQVFYKKEAITSPIITEVTPIPTPTNDNTPNYTFHSTKAGTITYSGGCSSNDITAVEGNNTITFNALADGVYGGCQITVTDTSDNTSEPLIVNTFTIDTVAPVVVITSPGDGLITNQNSITLNWTVDGEKFSEEITLMEGENVLTKEVTDEAGNVGSDSITVILDTTPPVRSDGLPTGALPAGTTQATLSLTTDEDATCRYAVDADTEYSEMTGIFGTTGEKDHSTLITGLADGNSYTYYVRCQDRLGNTNGNDYAISFSVDFPPASSSGGGGGYSPPTNISSFNKPLTISYNQKGTLTQDLNDENKVKVEVPKGSVKSTTTFTVNEGSLKEGDVPKDKIGAFLFNGLVFNIEAVDAGGNTVREFLEDLTITLTVPDLPDDTSTLELYYYDDEKEEWIIITGVEFGKNTITFKVNHLTRFALFEINAVKEGEVKGIADVDIIDGDIIQCETSDNPFAVYIVKIVGDTKYIRHIVSVEIFNHYGHLKWENLKQVDSLDNYSLSSWVRVNTGSNGTAAPTDRVYEINGDQTKHWVNMTAEQFLSHGGSETAIYSVNQEELDLYVVGPDVMML